MENPLLVFISSAIDGMAAERDAARAAIQKLPLTRPWRFEDSSAFSLPLARPICASCSAATSSCCF